MKRSGAIIRENVGMNEKSVNLVCGYCGRKESPPFDVGDSCSLCNHVLEIEPDEKNERKCIVCDAIINEDADIHYDLHEPDCLAEGCGCDCDIFACSEQCCSEYIEEQENTVY